MRLERKNHGSGHSYTLDGHLVPGVTTIIGSLDKPALVNWAASETAAWADEHWTELSEMRSADRIEKMKKARFSTNRKAVVKGNRVHALGERVSRGEEIPTDDIEPHLHGYVEGYAKALDLWEIEVKHSEMPVAHTDYRYAGTLDAIGYSPRLGNVLLDIKTGSGVYPEVALQLAAYRYANLAIEQQQILGPRGGKKQVWAEVQVPEIDTCIVAHVQEDGTRIHPITADTGVWNSFLHLLEVHESWVKRIAWGNRNQPWALSPIGDPIYPEDHPENLEETLL